MNLRAIFDGATAFGVIALVSVHVHLLLGWVALRARTRRLELTVCPALAVTHETLPRKAANR